MMGCQKKILPNEFLKPHLRVFPCKLISSFLLRSRHILLCNRFPNCDCEWTKPREVACLELGPANCVVKPCPIGYVYDNNTDQCIDLNECSVMELLECDTENGHCSNKQGGYECTCKKGFELVPQPGKKSKWVLDFSLVLALRWHIQIDTKLVFSWKYSQFCTEIEHPDWAVENLGCCGGASKTQIRIIDNLGDFSGSFQYVTFF